MTQKKLDNDISETQFEFNNGFETREALFSSNALTQRSLICNKDVYVCFLNYDKTFDKVCPDELMAETNGQPRLQNCIKLVSKPNSNYQKQTIFRKYKELTRCSARLYSLSITL